jgi:hypothetical protein
MLGVFLIGVLFPIKCAHYTHVAPLLTWL